MYFMPVDSLEVNLVAVDIDTAVPDLYISETYTVAHGLYRFSAGIFQDNLHRIEGRFLSRPHFRSLHIHDKRHPVLPARSDHSHLT